MAFGSEVPPSYVEFVSEMLAQTPLEVVSDFYPAFNQLDEYAALKTISELPSVVLGGEDDMITPVDHTANHPGAGGPHTVVGPQDNVESTEIINRGQSSEGNNR